ncbi:unnamed protein product [Lota lota]
MLLSPYPPDCGQPADPSPPLSPPPLGMRRSPAHLEPKPARWKERTQETGNQYPWPAVNHCSYQNSFQYRLGGRG